MKQKLRLWHASVPDGMVFLILAVDRDAAGQIITDRYGITTPRVISEIPGPFENGDILIIAPDHSSMPCKQRIREQQ